MHAVLYSRSEKGIQLDQSANVGATPTLAIGAPEHEPAEEETESARLEETRRIGAAADKFAEAKRKSED